MRMDHGTVHALSPKEGANFEPFGGNFSLWIDQLYEEDYSKIYDEHVGSSEARFATMRGDLDFVIRLENALADWRDLQSRYPEFNLPDIDDYVSKKARSRFGKRMLSQLTDEEVEKSCWVMRKSYCALPYRLPDRCESLFTCVEVRDGNHTLFIPETDLDDHMHDLFNEMIDPLHLDFKPRKGKKETGVFTRSKQSDLPDDEEDYEDYPEEVPVKVQETTTTTPKPTEKEIMPKQEAEEKSPPKRKRKKKRKKKTIVA